MSDPILTFTETGAETTTNPPERNFVPKVVAVSPDMNPYKDSYCPNDVYDYLLPDGSKFGMFSDPYGSMKYVEVEVGARNGYYWLEQRLNDHTFTPREIKLIEFLSEHRVATRSQIQKVVFPETDKAPTIKDFLRTCRSRGIICSFSWVTPLQDERRKPIVYGLSRAGASAAEILYRRELPKDFSFHPINFPPGKGPSMNSFYMDLAANELYSELVRIDRLISWKRSPQIRLDDNSWLRPGAEFEVIKDAGEFRLFWVETVRVGKEWIEKAKLRFQRIQHAYSRLSPYQRPVRVIIVADGDSRIPMLGEMAAAFMPEVHVRFTTDERLLNGIGKDTFLSYSVDDKEVKISSISFLQENHEGLKASEYLAQQNLNLEDEDDMYE